MGMHRAREIRSESSSQSRQSLLKRKAPEDEIRLRAYQIYLARNRMPGRALDDWLQAERELQIQN
jgi:hypothetical protein